MSPQSGRGIKISEAFVQISSRGLSGVNRDFGTATNRLGDFAKRLDASSRNMSGFGRVGSRSLSSIAGGLSRVNPLMVALGAAAGAVAAKIAIDIGIKSVGAAASLQSALADVATISPQVRDNIGGITNEIQRLSIAANTDTKLLSAGLYQTISSGITDTTEAMDFLRVSAIAAKAGLTSVEVAVDGLSSTTNAFGIQASEVGTVADKFFKTIEKGKLRFENIAGSIGNVAPIASQLGVSLDDLLATTSALTTGGQSYAESVTGIRQILVSVLRPSNQAATAAADLAAKLGIADIGFNAAGLRAKGLVGFLKDLEQQTGGNSEVLAALFPRVEGLNAVIAVTGKVSKTIAENQKAIAKSAGAANAAFKIQQEAFNAQADLLKNQVNVAWQDLGYVFIPAATKALTGLNNVMRVLDFDKLTRFLVFSAKINTPILGTVFAAKFVKTSAINAVKSGINAVTGVGEGEGALPPRTDPSLHHPPSLDHPRRTFQVGGLKAAPTRGTQRPPQPQQHAPQGLDIEIPSATDTIEQSLEVQEQGIERAIDAFERWQAQFDVGTLNAQEQMERFTGFLEQNGVVIENNVIRTGKQTDAWITAQSTLSRFRGEVNRTQAAQSKLSAELVKELKAIPAGGLTAFYNKQQADAALKFTEDQRLSFNNLTNDMMKESLRTEANIGRFQADRILAQLELLKLETDERIASIKKMGLTAIQQEQAITAEFELQSMKRRQIGSEMGQAPSFVGELIGQMIQLTTGKVTGKVPVQDTFGERFAEQFEMDVTAAGKQVVGSMKLLGATIQGAKGGGLVGALSALAVATISETEGFNRLLGSVDEVSDSLIDSVDPAVSAIVDSLTPALEGLAALLVGLKPIFELVGVVNKALLTPMRLFGEGLSKLGDGIKGIFGDNDFLAGRPQEEVQRAGKQLLDLKAEFKRLQNLDKLPAEIAKLPAHLQEIAFIKANQLDVRDLADLINIPLPFGGQIQLTPEQLEKARESRGEDRQRTGGIQISNITGPTRDLLISALSPLKQLDTTFPAMLDELRAIRGLLGGGDLVIPPSMMTPDVGGAQSPVVNQPTTLANIKTGQVPTVQAAPAITPNTVGGNGGNPALARESIGGLEFQGVTINGDIVVNVEQMVDANIDEINRQLHRQLRIDQRRQGSRRRVANIT